ncbi:uncharacterized protein [Eleutherodactylus coqui]|uniref:uncharacterized protein n=1 Tax=Eleutherodactylus coqui TaxID=57060 RepID=UPI003462098A
MVLASHHPRNRALKSYVSEALANRHIRPSRSPAGAGLFFVEKKDGTLRPCVDYRALNKITVKNQCSLPLIPDLLNQVVGAHCFSKLDLRGAYNLIRIREGDEWKTAFNTPLGHFECLVMPFGLCNAPAVFQGFMNAVFHDFLGVFLVIYLDDILVYSPDWDSHVRHLRLVLTRLREYQLFVKLEKCTFGSKQISFLGYVISPTEIQMESDKVAAISQWVRPDNLKALQRFLGFANFYRKFIRNYSVIAQPLTDLTKKGANLGKWSPAALEAFSRLKKAFTTRLVGLSGWPPESVDLRRGGVVREIVLPESGKLQRVTGTTISRIGALKSYVSEALANRHIRPSRSPAGAGLFFVEKKDGTLRPCVDYRALNKITVKNQCSLPLIPDLLNQVVGAHCFSKLDLRGAYNLIRIREGDEWKTAFNTPLGHFECLVMPFGLCNAPAVFQGFMNAVFHDFLGVFLVIYLDDILVYSPDWDSHVRHLRLVLTRLREYQLFVKLEKCTFGSKQISFLGYVISPTEIQMESDKVAAISQWVRPDNLKALQRFLGFANFYRKFIRNYSVIAQPLTDLTKKGANLGKWSPAALEAFSRLKKAFTTGYDGSQ